jgi:hypothetical protein
VHPPGMHVTGTSPPPKRRKVTSNADHAMPAVSPLTEELVLGGAEPSSSRITNSNAEKVKSSVRTQSAQSGKSKRKASKHVALGDESAGRAETSRKKRKKINGISPGREPRPEHETSNSGDVNMPSDIQKKHLRKEKTVIPANPTGRCLASVVNIQTS